jgi:tetratricopeptide (TPR) repeat protein
LLAGNLPATSPLTPPDGTLVAWHGLLEAAEDNWLVWYHRGVARWAADDRVGALEAWWASNQAEQNPWALRNLAIGTKDVESALSSYEQAVELTSPQLGWLFLEAINFSLEQGDLVRAARIHAGADTALRADGRFQLVEVRLRLGQGDAAGAEALLEQGIELAGLREGANQLAELWCLVQQQLGTDRPVPAAYDFSMFGDD